MPSVRQPATALRDRAERHVFGLLGDLPAVERRVLALLELADVDRAGAARDAGLDEQALSAAAARARKALRRTRKPLVSGARCDRAEVLLSDRLDIGLDRHARKWLEIHLARCPRCAEHEALLAEAREELRSTFTDTDRPVPLPTPEQQRPEEERAKLRVVPPAPEDSPAPESTPDPHPESTEWTVEADMRPQVPTRREEAATETASPVPVPAPARAPRPARLLAPSPAARRAAKILAILLVIVGILAGIGLGLSALGGGDDHPTAPWAQPGAPEIHPAPLSGQ